MKIIQIFNEKNINKLFNAACIMLFFFLFICSFRITGVNSQNNLADEHIYFKSDSLVQNIIGILMVSAVALAIYKIYSAIKGIINMDIIAIVVSILALIISIYWIGAANTAPQADQESLCNFAEAFNNGDYSGLQAGGYVARYPQQLGMITFMRILFRVFGNWCYPAFQYFTAGIVPVLIFSGYRITGKLTSGNKLAELYYLLFMLFCIPLYGYTPFVYGEICSTALVMLSVWLFLSDLEKPKWKKSVGLGIIMGITVQMRQNTLIVMIGFLIVILVKLCTKKENRAILVRGGIVLILGVIMFQVIINMLYRDKIPKDYKGGIPPAAFIAMGVNDDNNYPGWYNGYNRNVYSDNEYDPKKAETAANEKIYDFMKYCSENPGYAVDFYYRKINAQWNAPMYQCLVMNNRLAGSQSSIASRIYNGEWSPYLEKIMNIYQLMLYGSILLLLIVCRSTWEGIEKYVLLIGVFGGFLFSILWEAKTRYIFPYFIMLIPYAAAGMSECLCRIHFKKGK